MLLFLSVLSLRVSAAEPDAVQRQKLSLEGIVRGVFPQHSMVLLQQGEKIVAVEAELMNPILAAGQRARISGPCRQLKDKVSFLPFVLDDDGMHPVKESHGSVYLEPGRHSLELRCFQAGGDFALELKWQLPGSPIEKIPPSALSHTPTDPAASW